MRRTLSSPTDTMVLGVLHRHVWILSHWQTLPTKSCQPPRNPPTNTAPFRPATCPAPPRPPPTPSPLSPRHAPPRGQPTTHTVPVKAGTPTTSSSFNTPGTRASTSQLSRGGGARCHSRRQRLGSPPRSINRSTSTSGELQGTPSATNVWAAGSSSAGVFRGAAAAADGGSSGRHLGPGSRARSSRAAASGGMARLRDVVDARTLRCLHPWVVSLLAASGIRFVPSVPQKDRWDYSLVKVRRVTLRSKVVLIACTRAVQSMSSGLSDVFFLERPLRWRRCSATDGDSGEACPPHLIGAGRPPPPSSRESCLLFMSGARARLSRLGGEPFFFAYERCWGHRWVVSLAPRLRDPVPSRAFSLPQGFGCRICEESGSKI